MTKRIEQLLEQVQVNAKIQELAKKSGCSIDKLGYGEGNLEKFAELLIVKCANIIWHEADIKDSVEINEGGYKILEHFGIDWTSK